MTVEELKNRFKSVKRIKKGGQKVVFKAKDNSNTYALKLISCPNDPRVVQEIKIVSSYDIQYVPKMIETGTVVDEADGETIIYIIEEFVEGQSLRDYLRKGNKFNLKEAYTVLEMLLKIECQLEDISILHRDINPNNIILLSNGEIRLIDFGLAKILGETSLTQTSANFGPFTPGYAPYEQVANMKMKQDVRTDLFQIGVTVYELVTGKNPFINKKDDLYNVLNKTITIIPPVLTLDGDSNGLFSQFINMLMAKNQSQRPDTAKKAYEYLKAIHSTLEME